MEIGRVSANSIKIKTKTTTIVVDPTTKTDADVVIVTTPDTVELPPDAKLVIEGPGEYEVGGVRIKGIWENNTLRFQILDDQYNVLILFSDEAAKIKDEDEYDAVILRATPETREDALSQFSADTLVLFGENNTSLTSKENIKQMNKVNLKKKDEVKGFTILLSS